MLAAWGSAFGPMPAMTIESTGFGAGTREVDDPPNCTQVVIGSPAESIRASSFGQGQQLVQLEANLDDVTGETLAHAVEALLGDGALDAWVTPVLMKKGRPGHVVSVLCDPVLVGDLRRGRVADRARANRAAQAELQAVDPGVTVDEHGVVPVGAGEQVAAQPTAHPAGRTDDDEDRVLGVHVGCDPPGFATGPQGEAATGRWSRRSPTHSSVAASSAFR